MRPYDQKLRGNRQCQCGECFEYFSSVSGFDKHRYGDYTLDPKTRKCRAPAELKAMGWTQNERGFWMRPGPGSPHAIKRSLAERQRAQEPIGKEP